MKKIAKKINLFVLIVLLISIAFNVVLCRGGKEEHSDHRDTIRIETVDTITVHDTIRIEKPKFISKTIKDTIYVDTNDGTIPLELVSKHYSEKDKYGIWISGIEPLSLDSVWFNSPTKIIERKEYVKVVEEIKRTSMYGVLDLSSFRGVFSPSAGISITSKNNFLYGAKIGFYDGSITYGATIGYKFR